MLFLGLLFWPSPRPWPSWSGWLRLWQQPAGPGREPSVPPPPTPPLPPTSSSLPNSTSPHPTPSPCHIFAAQLCDWPKLLVSHLIFRVIQKITGPLLSPVASGRSIFFFFFYPCGVAAPILRIRANDGIVSPALPPQRSNLRSCSDRSSRERQDGGNNICSKKVNSSL